MQNKKLHKIHFCPPNVRGFCNHLITRFVDVENTIKYSFNKKTLSHFVKKGSKSCLIKWQLHYKTSNGFLALIFIT